MQNVASCFCSQTAKVKNRSMGIESDSSNAGCEN